MDNLVAYGPLVLSGIWLTVSLAIVSLLLAMIFGFIGAWMKLSRSPVLAAIGSGYTTLIRGIPDLVLMLLIFFGGQQLVNSIGKSTGWWGYVEISPFVAGSFSIGFIFGAYMTETFRGAYKAIDPGQIEAAVACGLGPITRLRIIIWPQFVPHALPGFNNNWLVLMKTTALVSIIGLHDIMYNAGQAGRASKEPFLFLLMAFVIYLGLTAASEFGLRRLSRHYAIK